MRRFKAPKPPLRPTVCSASGARKLDLALPRPVQPPPGLSSGPPVVDRPWTSRSRGKFAGIPLAARLLPPCSYLAAQDVPSRWEPITRMQPSCSNMACCEVAASMQLSRSAEVRSPAGAHHPHAAFLQQYSLLRDCCVHAAIAKVGRGLTPRANF